MFRQPGRWSGGGIDGEFAWYPWPDGDSVALLHRQWDAAIELVAGTSARSSRDAGIERIALELHPLHLVYNVPTLQRMRDAVGPIIGANLDPSHLFWQQMDPLAVIRALGPAVHHVHLKDTGARARPGRARRGPRPAARSTILRTGRGSCGRWGSVHGPEVLVRVRGRAARGPAMTTCSRSRTRTPGCHAEAAVAQAARFMRPLLDG